MYNRIPIVYDPSTVEIFNNINPANIAVDIADSLTEMLFNLPNKIHISIKEYQKALETRALEFDILEGTTKKYGKIYSSAFLELIEGYTNTFPFTQFDKAVFIACLSQQQAGCSVTTVDIVYRQLIGAVMKSVVPEQYVNLIQISDGKLKAHDMIRDWILTSLDKLQGTRITVNMQKVCELFKNYNLSGYDPGNIKDSILPGFILEKAVVNGQCTCDVIKFDRPSPLFIIAQAKKQIIKYPIYIMNVTGVPTSPFSIPIIGYTTHRIQVIIRHHLTPVITFEDVFEKCGLTNASKRQQLRARKLIIQFMEHLVHIEIIKNFTVPKEGRCYPRIVIEY